MQKFLMTIRKLWEPKSTMNNTEKLIGFENESISIIFQMEKIDPIPTVSNALEYTEYSKSFIEKHYASGYPKYTVDPVQIVDYIGGREFLLSPNQIQESADYHPYFTHTYTAQFDDYLLNILVSFTGHESEKEVKHLLESIIWD
jgi:hypothetical protein